MSTNVGLQWSSLMLDYPFSACQETKLPHADVRGLRALHDLHDFPEGASAHRSSIRALKDSLGSE